MSADLWKSLHCPLKDNSPETGHWTKGSKQRDKQLDLSYLFIYNLFNYAFSSLWGGGVKMQLYHLQERSTEC
jgi:hypothetical protein